MVWASSLPFFSYFYMEVSKAGVEDMFLHGNRQERKVHEGLSQLWFVHMVATHNSSCYKYHSISFCCGTNLANGGKVEVRSLIVSCYSSCMHDSYENFCPFVKASHWRRVGRSYLSWNYKKENKILTVFNFIVSCVYIFLCFFDLYFKQTWSLEKDSSVPSGGPVPLWMDGIHPLISQAVSPSPLQYMWWSST